MLQALLNDLYAALSRDPQAAAAIAITLVQAGTVTPPSSYWIEVKDDVLTGTAQQVQALVGPTAPFTPTPLTLQNIAVDLHAIPIQSGTGHTLADLVSYLNTVPGFQAKLTDSSLATRHAAALVERRQDIVAEQSLGIYTSVLHGLFKPIAWALKRAHDEGVAGLKESQPFTAAGFWLSNLGDLYGVDRLPGETDENYKARIIYTVVKPRCNNVAMTELLRYALQATNITVDDAPVVGGVQTPFHFDVNIYLAPNTPMTFNVSQITTIVNAIKAWGTIWSLVINTISTTNAGLDVIAQYGFILPYTDTATLLKLDQSSTHILQRVYDYFTVQKHFLTWTVYKDGGGVVISALTNQDVVFENSMAPRHMVPYYTFVEDFWNPFTIQYTSHDSTYGGATDGSFKVGIGTSDAKDLRGTQEIVSTTIGPRTVTETKPPRWRIFRWNDRASTFNNPSYELSASLTEAISYAQSVGDTSVNNTYGHVVTRTRGVSPLIKSGNEIDDTTRLAGVQGDGQPYPDYTTGIWPAATNLVSNGGAEVNTSFWSQTDAGFGVGLDGLVRSTAQAKFGTGSFKLTMNTLQNYPRAFLGGVSAPAAEATDGIGVGASQQYTLAFWDRIPAQLGVGTGSQVFITVESWDTAGNPLGGGDTAALTLTTSGAPYGWTHRSVTFTTPASTAHVTVRWVMHQVTGDWYVDGVQLETGAIATPYIETNGATASRSAARVQVAVTVNGLPVINATQGWIAVRVRIPWPAIPYTSVPQVAPNIFVWGDSAAANELRLCYDGGYAGSMNDWVMNRFASGVQTAAAASQTQTFAANTLHLVIGTWTATSIGVAVDGGAIVTTAQSNVPALAATLCDIGANSALWPGRVGTLNVAWGAFGTGTLTNADSAIINGWGSAVPSPDQLIGLNGGQAQPTLLIPGDMQACVQFY